MVRASVGIPLITAIACFVVTGYSGGIEGGWGESEDIAWGSLIDVNSTHPSPESQIFSEHGQ